jgi:hypothetical protein
MQKCDRCFEYYFVKQVSLTSACGCFISECFVFGSQARPEMFDFGFFLNTERQFRSAFISDAIENAPIILT